MGKFKTMDANEAVSRVAYHFSEICGIYPITPASPMAENVDIMSNKGEKNFLGNQVEVVEMQSEAGAIALVHGAMQSGVLASTFTASQGLLLMIPSLYKLAGEMLPAVIHVSSRSLSTHALSIFGDHQDIYSIRSTGVCMLASNNVEESQYIASIAHLSAIKSILPFVHFFDGFRTSHEINKINLIDLEKLNKLIDKKSLTKFRENAMNSNNPTTRGTAENDDIYFQHTESRNINYINAVDDIVDIMNKINNIYGTNIQPFNYYGSKNATNIIICMGSVSDTVMEVVDYLNKSNNIYGMITVHLYRPFSVDYLLKEIPKTVKKIAVLDRAKDFTSAGEPLYLDVSSALKNTDILVVGGRYGLSSKNTTVSQIKAVFDNLDSSKTKTNFTIGITDDITNLSLKIDNKFKIPTPGTEILIYGYGSDGMVSTSKDLIKIIGDHTKNYVQGYFQYDSKKSGGVTRSHIRIMDKQIHKPYYVENPNMIVVSKDTYMYKYDILDNIEKDGTLFLNTNLNDGDLIKTLPNKVKYLLAKKNINFYTIDANEIVESLGLRNKISTCMEICIFKILDVINYKKVISIMKETNIKRFKNKGTDIININNKIVEESPKHLKKINVDKKWINLAYIEEDNQSIYNIINKLHGDTLPVSAFLQNPSGIFKGGNTSTEKRDIAEKVPCWNKEYCIQCNQCSFVCPHAVIRPFLLDKNDNEVENTPSIFPRGVNYSLGISYKDCTGCGLCSNTCPGKKGKKALEMVDYNRDIHKEEDFKYLLEHNINGSYTSKILNVKNESFMPVKFEFSGSCAGCGETAYLKNLTQVFQNRLIIANATGCSSIYGASVPSFPYNIAWANSLFEDNAEFGLGIYKGINLKREKIAKYMKKNLQKEKEIFNLWLNNSNNIEACNEVIRKIDFTKHKELQPLKDFLVPSSMWIIGGDGFAYDIGFGGLDHVLSQNDNVNVLVLDTEVYSNTGGQASKSSNYGAVSKFASTGKSTYKKDLARIAMCYPNCYVACCNIGYNKEQYLKALKEASEHDGPSLIICYAPCIEHGIKKGMNYSLENASLATKCGYFLTFRYHPDKLKLYLDSTDVDFSLYNEFLELENRYQNLKTINQKTAKSILESQKEWAINRYSFYKKMSSLDE